MKNDSISRQTAIDVLNKIDVSDGVGISSIACGVQESAIAAIQHLPSVQSERKKGKWIFKKTFPNDESEFPMGCLICSECGSHHSNATPCNFCDNCGADMR